MPAKRSIVYIIWCLLLIFLTFSAEVLGARDLPNNMEEDAQSPTATNRSRRSSRIGNEGFVAYVNREVPSSPDPLHN